ncbi:MAG TPA: hypothetical protein VFZ91_12635 [Allosphingosinicella sp.]
MESERLTIRAAGPGAPDAAAMARLRREVETMVAPVERPAGSAADAKGGLIDVAAFVIAGLSTPAAIALIGVLKAHFARERGTEIEIEGPGGKFRLKAADAGKLDLNEWRSTINRILARK